MCDIALLSHSYLAKLDMAEMGEITPRISIATIAGYLRSKNVDVKVITNKGIGHIIKEVGSYRPKIIGLPAFTTEIHDAAEIAMEVKRFFPEAIIVVGGPHPSALPRETLLEFPVFDIAIKGEGEEVLLELLSDKKLKDISGIAYKKGNDVLLTPQKERLKTLDILPIPAFDLFDLDYYRKNNNGKLLLMLESSRGCPFNCNFCYRIVGRNVMLKSPQRIVDELEFIIKEYMPDSIVFENGIFVTNRSHSLKVCEEITKRKLKLPHIEVESTSHMLKDIDFVRELKKVGICSANFGIESGNENILKKVGKGQSLEQIKEAVATCNLVGIEVDGFTILGHPYETRKTIYDTIKFTRKLELRSMNYAIMVPFPGTEVRAMAEQGLGGYRLLSNDWRLYGKQSGNVLELEQLPRSKLIKLQMLAYFSWYFYKPKRIVKFLKNHLKWDIVKWIIRRLFKNE